MCGCVYACFFFFFFSVTTAYTVKRGHDREVGARGPRGLFKRIRFQGREHFFSLFFSLLWTVLCDRFPWFFLFSLSLFVRFHVRLTTFSPFSYFRLLFFFVSSLFLSFFLFFCFVFPNDRPLSMLLKGVDGYR